MLLQIADILDRPAIEAIREALADDRHWTDGAATAKGRARAAKNNLQAAETPETKGVLETIRFAVWSHDLVRSAAQPAKFARVMINRYGEGMRYGDHVDAPYIDGVRTDVSFTLFLADPEEYDGGELVIDTAGAEDRIKLPAGALVLYPATSIHRVETVTRGARICAVGWIKSRIRSAEQRAMLFEIERLNADLAVIEAPDAVRDRAANLKNNLLRAFGE
ncbi:MAG: Fe2+-dependent dioxygenase [Parvularculaceae bacterium]